MNPTPVRKAVKAEKKNNVFTVVNLSGLYRTLGWAQAVLSRRCDCPRRKPHPRPGVDETTPLVGVSSSGFEKDAPLDLRLTPADLIAAWRASGGNP